MATTAELFPIFLNSFKLSDRPADNKRNNIPISAKLLTTGSKTSVPSPIIKPMFPIIAPRTISPKIIGCFSFLDKNLPTNATARTITMLVIKFINL